MKINNNMPLEHQGYNNGNLTVFNKQHWLEISSLTSLPMLADKSGLTGLNPLATIRGLITDICYYRQQIKLLDLEQQRIAAQAAICHQQIDAQLQISLKMMDDQQKSLEAAYQLVAQELSSQRMARADIINLISQLTASMIDSTISQEEKQLSQITLIAMIDLLKVIGEQCLGHLSILSQNSQAPLRFLPATENKTQTLTDLS